MIAETPGAWNSCYRQDDPCAAYPGWRKDPFLDDFYGTSFYCTNDRTLHRDPYGVHISFLQEWWAGLSATEKEIEEALAATNTEHCTGGPKPRSPFLHIEQHSFDFVSGWITSNTPQISDVAARLSVDPALVAGVLMSEMLFDYDWKDQASDWSARQGIPITAAGGFGYSNAHEAQRQQAFEYIQQFFESGPDNIVNIGDVDESWLTTDYGAILTAAIMIRWVVDPYIDQVGIDYTAAVELPAEDMAMIWPAYRAGIVDAFGDVETFQSFLTVKGLTSSCNAQLALPIMRYTKMVFP
jgi:hypothetical protein